VSQQLDFRQPDGRGTGVEARGSWTHLNYPTQLKLENWDGVQVVPTSTCKSLCLIERLFLVKISFDIKNEYIYFYIKLTKGYSMGFDLYGNNKGNSIGEYF